MIINKYFKDEESANLFIDDFSKFFNITAADSIDVKLKQFMKQIPEVLDGENDE